MTIKRPKRAFTTVLTPHTGKRIALAKRRYRSTPLSPHDEEAILQLVLSDGHSSGKLPSFLVHHIWLELCRRRLGLTGTPAEDASLQQDVAQFMRSCNLIDRVHLLYSLLQEFASDAALKEAVFGATYVVTSPSLSWFEWLVVSLLIEAGISSSLKFECFPSSTELPFFHLQQCQMTRESFLPMDQIQRTLLAYLSVAVNVKNTLDLALIINRPFRGFGR
ncbi:unnamed protein product, partial [Dibothriocephalus latus]